MVVSNNMAGDGVVDRPLTVLHVSLWLLGSGGGGIQTYLATVFRALEVRGVRNRFAALMPGSVPEYCEPDAVRLGQAGMPKWRLAWQLTQYLSGAVNNVDIVHVHGALGWPALCAWLVCRRHRVPYVISPHGTLYPWFQARLSWRLRLYSRLFGAAVLHSASAIVVNKPAEAVVAGQAVSAGKIRIVRPGLRQKITEGRGGQVRPDSSFARRAVFVSRVEPLKGLEVLVRALEILRSHGLYWRVDVIGADVQGHTMRIRQMSRQLGVEKQVSLHGYLSECEKFSLISEANVFVMPSHAEAFSFATAEAIASGLPVVVSSEVALSDVVREYQCGIVFPAGDPAALADALREFEDDCFWTKCRYQALACATAEFPLSLMGERLESVYRQTIEEFQGIA